MVTAQEQALITKKVPAKTEHSSDAALPYTGRLKINFHGGPASLSVANNVPADKFGKLTALDMLQHLFRSYGAIDEIGLK